MKSSTIACLLCLFFIACTQTDSIEDIRNDDALSIESLIIGDDFTFSNSSQTSIEILPLSEAAIDQKGNYRIYGVDIDTESNKLLRQGFFTLSEGKELLIDIGNHFDEISIYMDYDGNLISFNEERTSNISVEPTKIKLAGRAVNKSNCLPSGYSIGENSGTFSITVTDKDISNVVFLFSDNSEIKIENPESVSGGSNNGNVWTFSEAPYNNVSDIQGVWIKSGCNQSGDGPGYGQYVSNSEYGQSETDIDNDGVPAANDFDDDDPNVASINYYPSRDGTYTLAFEDLWPNKGDYDFNDLVVRYNYELYTNGSGGVTRLKYTISVVAIGATYDNDFAFSFSDPANSASLTTSVNENISVTLEDNGNNSDLVFNSIKSVFSNDGYINTVTDRQHQEPKELNGTIQLDGSTTLDEFQIEGYLKINQEEGREVHLPNHAGSVNIDPTLFGTGNDDSDPNLGRYFKTQNNLPWALKFPIEWEHPKEFAAINTAYKRFETWAEGNSDLDWYTVSEENTVQENLYSVE